MSETSSERESNMRDKKYILTLIVIIVISIFLFVKMEVLEQEFEEKINNRFSENNKVIENVNENNISVYNNRIEVLEEENLKLKEELLEFMEMYNHIQITVKMLDHYDLGTMDSRITALGMSSNIWEENILKNKEIDYIIGKYVNSKFQNGNIIELSVILSSDGIIKTYPIDADYKMYGIDNYGYVKTEDQRFIKSVIMNEKEANSFIIVDGKIKYMFMGTRY